MSYCRWSSMNWRCDVYTYADMGGTWTTHVAARRRVIQPIPDIVGENAISPRLMDWAKATWSKESKRFVYKNEFRKAVLHAWFSLLAFWHNQIHTRSLHLIPIRPIGLKYDGATFVDDTPQDCALTLKKLRAEGYNVPQYAIDALMTEEDDEKTDSQATR